MLKIFHICSSMKYAHLPWPGAISDQHPELFEFFMFIWGKQAEEDKRREAEQKRVSRRGR